MITTIQNGNVISQTRSYAPAAPSLFQRFIQWTEGQQENRFVWLGIALTAHASFLTPFTVMAVMLLGNNLALFMAALGAMALSLVTNLAALPTRITIPAFLLSIAIDVAIVLTALFLSM